MAQDFKEASTLPKREIMSSSKLGSKRLKIGIIGFGKFGQFIGKTFIKNHDVFAMSREDYSMAAKEIGEWVICADRSRSSLT